MMLRTPTQRSANAGLAVLLVTLTGLAHGQDPQSWREDASAPPAQFSTTALQAFDVSRHGELRYGLDPKTLVLGQDGVLRFVMVATSPSGAQNVLYEGMRCQTWETKTYARWDAASGWRISDDARWRSWIDEGSALPAKRLSQAGMCEGRSPNLPIAKILKDLREGRSLYLQ